MYPLGDKNITNTNIEYYHRVHCFSRRITIHVAFYHGDEEIFSVAETP